MSTASLTTRELYRGPLASAAPLQIVSTDSDHDGCPELLVGTWDAQQLLVGDCDLDTPWRAYAFEYDWATLVALEPGVLAISSHDARRARLTLECGQPRTAWEVSARAEQALDVQPVAVARGPEGTLVVADQLDDLHIFTVANCELSAISRHSANNAHVLALRWFQAPQGQVLCMTTAADVPAMLLECASWPLDEDSVFELRGGGWLFDPDIFLEQDLHIEAARFGVAQVARLSFGATGPSFTPLARLPEPFTPQLVTASRSPEGSVQVLYTSDHSTLTALTLDPPQRAWREQALTDLGDGEIVALHSTLVDGHPATVIVLRAGGVARVLMLRSKSS
ncbi:hypothetical protein G6O69_16735 [Pseudenhygromyxa sp. WMMC2535]|uniref:hypothetical protein n=1 Tax=Pseudenhygromyxa sp. WMMC2535 TaxID=2712867 RepID=UPI0015953E30|nr:hypothetical protein [Pseudenhygromyxa sp. WMMC2535]NVB39491.1 hypothetical protein [Pseudenhygromyxa sp. WMMC2535]